MSFFLVFYKISPRGKRQLVVNGFAFICRTYCVNHIKKIWKCASHSDCTAKVHTVADQIVSLNNSHNHSANPLIRLTSQRFLQNKGANRFIFHNSVFYISQFKPCLELKIVCFAQILFVMYLWWWDSASSLKMSTVPTNAVQNIVCKIKWNIRFYFVYCIV